MLAVVAILAAACSAAPAGTPVVIYVTTSPNGATATAAAAVDTPAVVTTPAPVPPATVEPTSPATPTAAPDPLATPAPTLVPGVDPNVVYFGSNYESESLTISVPRDTFRRREKIAFAFYLREPVGVRTISMVISKEAPGGGSSSVRFTEDLEVNPEWKRFANKWRLGSVLRGTGAFVMRFYVGDTEIAEGTFNLTR